MGKHLTYRSGNPVLTSNAFNTTAISSETMTINGTVNKTFLSLTLLMVTGYYTFMSGQIMSGFAIFSLIAAFIVAIITMYKKEWSPITVPIYAILEGIGLGWISYSFNSLYDGIVLSAICITVSILLAMLMIYRSGLIKPTENFKLGVAAATGGIALLYIINLVMSFFGSQMGIMNIQNASLMSIGFSLFVIVIAALNLVVDFDFIEEGAEKGAPKYMEWFGALGLMVTLVWLYLEILRLLAKLRSR
tara:strand:- start:4363 stop:5103 length:741 start_codon:yes stop_codon:yes gene_type:complete